jgi:hypothetical protein
MKSLFYKWLFTIGALLVVIFCVFFPQVRAISSDWFSFSAAAGSALVDSDLGAIKEVKFVDEREIIAQVSAGDLRVLAHSGHSATIGVKLTSTAPTDVYPSLRIFLKTGNQTGRTLVLGPTQYAHGSTLVSEQVTIPISLLPGETGFTAQAFYAASGDVK